MNYYCMILLFISFGGPGCTFLKLAQEGCYVCVNLALHDSVMLVYPCCIIGIFCSTMSFAVVVPDRAFVLDWVFADGPPQSATVYDNNHRQDFHAIVPNGIPEELYWVEEEHQIYRKLQEERRLREDAIRAKVS